MNAPASIDETQADFLFGADESVVPQRAVLERAELLARLSSLLRSCEGCEPVKVVDIARLDPPDVTGCNWSSTLVLDPAGVAPEVYAAGYADVIVSARACWNLH